ncbi:MAG: exonuclease [Burkholderiales bacterium 68-12]|nr:MAG: exonuclease [Burkholderiales bacterium 68-12]
MTVIAKTDMRRPAQPAPMPLWQQVFQAVQAHARQCGAHLARTVVLVPYAQLMAEAQWQWALYAPDGFVPRLETTRNWAQQLGGFVPQGLDLALDVARDSFTAAALLERAGLGAQAAMLTAPLLEAATQLAPVVAAVPPGARAAWAGEQRALLGLAGEGGALRYEAAVARIALEWVVASRHASDVLFEPGVRQAVDALVVLEGFQADPLAAALGTAWGARALRLPLWQEAQDQGAEQAARGPHVGLHPALDAEDEAQRAAACVLAQVQAGRVPVALASTDRALVRRISALLEGCGQSVRDENGWTLSTTRAAAQVMAALRACAWNASTDAVLAWLKHLPVLPEGALRALERWLRRSALGHWSAALAAPPPPARPELAGTRDQVEALRRLLRGDRPLAAWRAALRALLQASGQWPLLEADPAGARVLLELHLLDAADALLDGAEGAGRRLSLAEFTRWADDVLEAARYKPAAQAGRAAEVVVLPLPQLLARPFAALVLPGCDEKRLQAAPEPAGIWTPAQRQALGLPTRAALEAAQRAAWACALRQPWVDLLWRGSDEGGEPLLASPLVLALPAALCAPAAADPRVPRSVAPAPVARPQPQAAALLPAQLSASAYADLRHCPYRFYALRLLGLQEVEELEAEVDKRDFGTWLHAVLQQFHDALQAAPTPDLAQRRGLLDAAAQQAQQALELAEAEFLPFAAGWPQVREGYLAWLAAHEAAGAEFAQAEVPARQPLALAHGTLELVGRIDRIDTAATAQGRSATLLLDYKTEGNSKTRERVKDGSEDTQLAFYAALVDGGGPAPVLRAAYVNVGERGETQMHEAPDVAALRAALLAGIRQDFDRLAQGAHLPALGEGSVCDWCAARGLCRKDFWNA